MSEKQDNQVQVPSSSGGQAGPKGPRKKNKQRAQARSDFNANAPRISLDSHFNGYIEVSRGDVQITYDTGFLDRLAQNYLDKVIEYKVSQTQYSNADNDLEATTYAVLGFGVIRKLLLSAPSSGQLELSKLSYIRKAELFVPPASASAIDNLGKFDYGDSVCRLRYHEQDIYRTCFKIMKVASYHSFFDQQPCPTHFSTPGVESNNWNDLDPDKLVFPLSSSVRWLREESLEFLRRAYDYHWRPEGFNYDVSYPKLVYDESAEKQLNNFISWIALLHADMPNVVDVVRAGLVSCWRLEWSRFPDRNFQNHLGDRCPALISGWTPSEVLGHLGVTILQFNWGGLVVNDWIQYLQDLHSYVISQSVPMLSRVFKFVRQPDNAFGSAAQLLAVSDEEKLPERAGACSIVPFRRILAQSECDAHYKVKEKGLVVAGLVFGFSKKVIRRDTYRAILSGDANNFKAQYLASDMHRQV